jgi:anti-sigma factor RsiW
MSTTPTSTCDGPRITAYVDGVLPPEARAEVEAHLLACPSCRDQEAFERGFRERMRELSAPAVSPGLEDRIRRRIRRRPLPAAVRWLPLAAGIALALLWGRGAAPFVAWEIARDHIHCFGQEHLPAQVWTSDPGEIAEWYRQSGTELPLIPATAGGVELVGGRYCALLDRKVAHLYYAGEKRHLSLYVVPGPARFAGRFVTRKQGENVRLLHTGGTTLALVSEDADLVDAFHRALSMSRADGSGLPPLPWRTAR